MIVHMNGVIDTCCNANSVSAQPHSPAPTQLFCTTKLSKLDQFASATESDSWQLLAVSGLGMRLGSSLLVKISPPRMAVTIAWHVIVLSSAVLQALTPHRVCVSPVWLITLTHQQSCAIASLVESIRACSASQINVRLRSSKYIQRTSTSLVYRPSNTNSITHAHKHTCLKNL